MGRKGIRSEQIAMFARYSYRPELIARLFPFTLSNRMPTNLHSSSGRSFSSVFTPLFTSLPLAPRPLLSIPTDPAGNPLVSVPITRSNSSPGSAASGSPLLTRPAPPQRGSSWTKPVRPTSLLQRGRSFTAEDLQEPEPEVEVEMDEDELVVGRERQIMRRRRTSDENEEDSDLTPTTTPTKSGTTFNIIRPSPGSPSPLYHTSPTKNENDNKNEGMLFSPSDTIIGSPEKQEQDQSKPFAAMLILPPTPEKANNRNDSIDARPPHARALFVFGLTSPPSLTRSNSACTMQELRVRPHAQQLEFMRPVEPSQVEACRLLEPLALERSKTTETIKGGGMFALGQAVEIKMGKVGKVDRQRPKLTRLASGIRLTSEEEE